MIADGTPQMPLYKATSSHHTTSPATPTGGAARPGGAPAALLHHQPAAGVWAAPLAVLPRCNVVGLLHPHGWDTPPAWPPLLQVVKVDRRKAGGEHTDAVPLAGGWPPWKVPCACLRPPEPVLPLAATCRQLNLSLLPHAEWLRHKRAFLRLRQLTFFGSFGLAKCFALWRSNARGRVLRRRRHQLSGRLFAASPAFAGPLAQTGALVEQLRGARATCVQPGRTYSAADWAEQQAAWRTRKTKPELDTTVVGACF